MLDYANDVTLDFSRPGKPTDNGGAVRGTGLSGAGGRRSPAQMTQRSPFRYFKTSPEIIRLAVMLYVRFPLSLRNVEDLLHERGIEVSHETVRFWWLRFGPMFAAEIRQEEGRGSALLPLAVAPRRGVREGQRRAALPLASGGSRRRGARGLVTKTRDKTAALKFLKKLMKRHGRAEELVTDKLRSYGAALKELGAEDRQVTERWENNRAENSHQPFRRRERAMLRFRRMHSLQKFAAVHSSVTNHFNSDRSLSSRQTYKQARTAALAEWRALCAG